MNELKVEIDSKSENIEEEFGDLIFSLVNLSRYLNIQSENALAKTNTKFIKRFQLMENLVEAEDLELSEMSLSEMDVYWEKAKNILKK
jgi:XTP/dITP diphosphohydrolase